jgi:RND family efflux transporter MFP subunit
VSGQVEEVLVDVGDRVKAGQVLVRIDPTLFEIEVQQLQAAVETARGALASAEADVQFAQREVPRQLDLFNRNAAAPKEMDEAAMAYERAIGTRDEKKGKLGEAQQRLRYGQQQLEETQIRAPYDGAITRRMVDPGQPASANPVTHLVEIQETGVLYLEFSLPQELLGTIVPGTPVTFDVEGTAEGQSSGEVAVLFPAIDEATRSFRCRVIVQNADLRLRPGLLAQVRVLTRQAADALVVPRRALSQTASGWQVLASGPAGPAARAVQVGLLTDEVAEITGGLQENDRVLLPPEVGR